MKIQKALDKFLEYEYVSGSSQKTIQYYKQTLGYFINFVGNIDVKNVTTKHYNSYVIFLRNKNVVNNNVEKNKKLSQYTICNRVIAVKAFFNYLYNNNYINTNIFENTKNFRYGKKVISILSKSQIIEILNFYDENTFLGSRNLLIISLFLDSGLRLSEVTNLNISDIHIDLHSIKVFGKGSKERFVPLSETTIRYFTKYRNFYNVKSGKLLVDEKFNPLTNSGISCMMRTLKKELGFEKLHPHFLRHTFATMFLMNGGDALSLQMILGHTTLTMTEKYVHIANQLMIADKRKFSTLSNLDQQITIK